jgi:hypothetical protein
MAHVIRLTTDKFDVSKERPNPINPIAGESLLVWLREKAKPRALLTEPDAEDWGRKAKQTISHLHGYSSERKRGRNPRQGWVTA